MRSANSIAMIRRGADLPGADGAEQVGVADALEDFQRPQFRRPDRAGQSDELQRERRIRRAPRPSRPRRIRRGPAEPRADSRAPARPQGGKRNRPSQGPGPSPERSAVSMARGQCECQALFGRTMAANSCRKGQQIGGVTADLLGRRRLASPLCSFQRRNRSSSLVSADISHPLRPHSWKLSTSTPPSRHRAERQWRWSVRRGCRAGRPPRPGAVHDTTTDRMPRSCPAGGNSLVQLGPLGEPPRIVRRVGRVGGAAGAAGAPPAFGSVAWVMRRVLRGRSLGEPSRSARGGCGRRPGGRSRARSRAARSRARYSRSIAS